MTIIERIVELVKESLDENWSNNNITHIIGEKNKHDFKSPNCIIWLCTGGSFGDNPKLGPKFYKDENGYDVALSPLPMGRIYSIDANIWGANYEAAEAIQDALIRALDNVFSSARFTLNSWENISEDPGRAGHANNGFKQNLSFDLLVPIPKEYNVTTVRLQELTFDNEFVEDLSEELSEDDEDDDDDEGDDE